MNFSALSHYVHCLPALGIPGGEAIVRIGHKTVFHETFGFSDAEKTRSASPNDLYYLYSASKVMTAAAGMKLIEDGLIGIDDPVSKYIPEFAHLTVRDGAGVREAKNVMTVAHLLTMRGGLSYEVTHPVIRETVEKNPQADTLTLVRAMAKMPLLFEPGTHFAYSLCLDVIPAIVEVVTGMKFSAYLQKVFAEPLGMEPLYFHVTDPGVGERMARQYRKNIFGKPDPIGFENHTILGAAYESGGGGIISTAENYSLFLDALANGGVGVNGARILKEETIRAMATNRLDRTSLIDYFAGPGNPGYGYGYGVRVMMKTDLPGYRSASSVGEFGWGGAAGVFVLVDPAKQLSFYYTQHMLDMGGFTYPDHPHNRMRDLIYEALEVDSPAAIAAYTPTEDFL